MANKSILILLVVLSVSLYVDAKLDHCPADRKQSE